MENSELSRTTLAIRAGQQRTVEGEHSAPIFATSSFVFEAAAPAAARFSVLNIASLRPPGCLPS